MQPERKCAGTRLLQQLVNVLVPVAEHHPGARLQGAPRRQVAHGRQELCAAASGAVGASVLWSGWGRVQAAQAQGAVRRERQQVLHRKQAHRCRGAWA